MNKNSLYTLAGSIWGLVGLFLVIRGAIMYQAALDTQSATQTALMISIAISIIIGVAKGRFVLSKTARRNKSRIESIEGPLKVHHVYAKSFYFLIAGMIRLGVLPANVQRVPGRLRGGGRHLLRHRPGPDGLQPDLLETGRPTRCGRKLLRQALRSL